MAELCRLLRRNFQNGILMIFVPNYPLHYGTTAQSNGECMELNQMYLMCSVSNSCMATCCPSSTEWPNCVGCYVEIFKTAYLFCFVPNYLLHYGTTAQSDGECTELYQMYLMCSVSHSCMATCCPSSTEWPNCVDCYVEIFKTAY